MHKWRNTLFATTITIQCYCPDIILHVWQFWNVFWTIYHVPNIGIKTLIGSRLRKVILQKCVDTKNVNSGDDAVAVVYAFLINLIPKDKYILVLITEINFQLNWPLDKYIFMRSGHLIQSNLTIIHCI